MHDSPPSASTSAAAVPTLPLLPPVTKFVPARSIQPERERHPVQPPLLPFITSSEGRDSILKLIQYSLRLTVYLRKRRTPSAHLTPLLAVVSLLSAARRVVSLVDLTSAALRVLANTWKRRGKSARAKGKMKETVAPSKSLDDERQWKFLRILSLEVLIQFTRNGLDLTSTLADNLYLFSRLRLLPVSEFRTHQAGQLASSAFLLSSALGLVLVHSAQTEVWSEGRAVRKTVLALEERSIYLEAISETEDVERQREVVNEERRLKEKARAERRRLRNLRDELSDLWWERLRLLSEGIFATYDVLGVQTGSEAIRSWSGMVSSGILFSQAWQAYYTRG